MDINYVSNVALARPDEMSLADFLRKAVWTSGRIQKHLRKRHAAALASGETEETLEAWAAIATSNGETMTASMYLSRYNDKYCGQWVLMNIPFRNLDDLWRDELNLVPDHLRYQALALLHRPAFWREPAAIRADLELQAFREHHIRNVLARLEANVDFIDRYLDGRMDKDDDEVEIVDPGAGVIDQTALAPDQQRIRNEIVDIARDGMRSKAERQDIWYGYGDDHEGVDEADQGMRAQQAAPRRQAFAVLGPAGSGKTTCVQQAMESVHRDGGHVLVVAPTGRLSVTFKSKYPQFDTDTIHGAFQIWKPFEETLELMMPYDMVVVEEIGQLSQDTFERMIHLWEYAEQLPTLVFVGDFYQLPGIEPTSARDSPLWRSARVARRYLHTMRRCKCPILRKKLQILRAAKPSASQKRFIVRGHKAPLLQHRGAERMQAEPPPEHILHILQETPQTLFLTISRRACAKLNRMAVEGLFYNVIPLWTAPIDPESNTDNYRGSAQIGDVPLMQPIYIGMRIMLTKNLNKEIGFVNGMQATVLGIAGNSIIVQTDLGRRIPIHPWTSEDRVVHYPLRVGYASTLHKVQGATLPHITLWLDVPNMPAAAYVALSRVEYDINWRFIGDPCVHHFTPARG
jgi:hypothetical protein